MIRSANVPNFYSSEALVRLSFQARLICGLLSVLICAGSLFAAEPPSLTINDVSVTEGNYGVVVAVFTVSLSAKSEHEVTVRYATEDGTAKAGSDYVSSNGVLVIPPAQNSAAIVVQVKSNRIENEERRFSVELSDALGAAIARSAGSGTIIDDDQGGTAR